MRNYFPILGAISSFLHLSDTPTDYFGQGLKTLQANVGEDALEFVVNSQNVKGIYPGSLANYVIDPVETDVFNVQLLATNTTFDAPSAGAVNGQKIVIRICDDTTPRTIAWNAIFKPCSCVLPVITLGAGKALYIEIVYYAIWGEWHVVRVAAEYSGPTAGAGNFTTIPPSFYDSIIQGTWIIGPPGGYLNGYFFNTSAAYGDKLRFRVGMEAGTYTIKALYNKGATFGIIGFDIDGVNVANFDAWSGAPATNVLGTQAGIVIATAGIKDLDIYVNGKNGSSHGYISQIILSAIYRTA